MHTSSKDYRPDIDGLRAIAVALVLVFHSGLFPLEGGFVGVDVFFVISGYLITGLLLAEFRVTGDIRLRKFLARRVSRLAPALLFTISVVLLAAPYLLSRIEGEIGPAAKAAIATLLLNANHFFLAASWGHVAAPGETNPFSHMWSLSVEEQFYLIWPPLLLLLMRSIPPARWPAAICALLTLALLSAWAMAGLDPIISFCLMPARGWELLAGAALAAVTTSRALRASTFITATFAFVGLVLIAWASIYLNRDHQFPFPTGIIPAVGAVLMILAGCIQPANMMSRFVGSPCLVYLGKISYPLYLWHWPVIVLLRAHRRYEDSWWQDLGATVLSVFLAVLTYELVEKRGRAWFSAAKRPGLTMLRGAIISLVLVTVALLLHAWARYG
ncbi:MAG: acyltransferase family protein [Lysobacterales bacterium]